MAPYGVCKLENTSKSTWISIFMDIKRKLSHVRDKVQNVKISKISWLNLVVSPLGTDVTIHLISILLMTSAKFCFKFSFLGHILVV